MVTISVKKNKNADNSFKLILDNMSRGKILAIVNALQSTNTVICNDILIPLERELEKISF